LVFLPLTKQNIDDYWLQYSAFAKAPAMMGFLDY
jgi:hypothetical protein